MICPVCGFDQARGRVCSQCQTPFSNVSASDPGDSSGGKSPVETMKEPPRVRKGQSLSERTPEKSSGSSLASSGWSEKSGKPTRADTESEAILDISPQPARGKPAPEKPAKSEKPEKQAARGESLSGISREGAQSMSEFPAGMLEKAGKPESPVPRKKEPDPALARERMEQLERIIVTTTPGIEGRMILSYQGIVTATVLVRVDLLVRQFHQGMTGEVASIRSSPLKEPFKKARKMAMADLRVEAAKRGGNAVVGLRVSQSPSSDGIWFHFVGTAVVLKE